jgi:hypothetical protein
MTDFLGGTQNELGLVNESLSALFHECRPCAGDDRARTGACDSRCHIHTTWPGGNGAEGVTSEVTVSEKNNRAALWAVAELVGVTGN